MMPTLLVGDMAQFTRYSDKEPLIGDVVYYSAPHTAKPTIHRIVARDAAGWITQGDNNCHRDPYRINADDIYGRVTAVHRGNRVRQLPGGKAGARLYRLRAAWRALVRRAAAPLRPLYYFLKDSGVGLRCCPKSYRPKLVVFRRGDEKSMLLIHRQRRVGYRDPQSLRWIIHAWPRLFVDEAGMARPVKPNNQ